ncbi:hypothetical protein [Alienimonas sp. DA493]|uniref:hypothetical protein n=1 Tax=Alienimonas sp. DA493 TaxID=3373605 RepID=UPI0037544257
MKTLISTAALALLTANVAAAQSAYDPHAGHDHGDHTGHDHGDHAGHDHGPVGDDHAGHDHSGLHGEHAGHDHGAHGGEVDRFGPVRVETLVDHAGLHFWLTDASGRALPTERVRGVVALRVEGSEKKYRYELTPTRDRDGRPEPLALPLNLGKVAGRRVAVAVRLDGVPGAGADEIVVRQTTRIVAPPAVGRPVRASSTDRTEVFAQAVCPVEDRRLGAMGTPWKVPVGDRAVFVCSEECARDVQADPAAFVAAASRDRIR